MTDNGSEFQKHFDHTCQKLGLKRCFSRPRTPKDNPEVERLIKTLIYEWLNDGHWSPKLSQFNKYITEWLIIYNAVRPHQKLNNLTPLQYAIKTGVLSKRLSSSTNDGHSNQLMLLSDHSARARTCCESSNPPKGEMTDGVRKHQSHACSAPKCLL